MSHSWIDKNEPKNLHLVCLSRRTCIQVYFIDEKRLAILGKPHMYNTSHEIFRNLGPALYSPWKTSGEVDYWRTFNVVGNGTTRMKESEDNSDTIQDTSKTFVSSVAGYFTSSSSCSDYDDILDEYHKDEISNSLGDKPYLDSQVLEFLNAITEETVCRTDSKTMIPKQQDSTRKKKRCAYLDYMLRLDAIGTPHSVSDTGSQDQDMLSGKKHSDDRILEAFVCFRKFLENLVQRYPCLAGETDVKAYSVPREWNDSMWENVLLEQDVSISILGVCDSVKCVAVLMALADILRDHLKSMKFIDSKTEHLSSLSPSIEVLDNRRLFRVLAWGFAALAGLDRLQAVDQDVSYTLQRVKRNCRALMCQERKEFGSKTYQSTYIVQLLIEKFYDQR